MAHLHGSFWEGTPGVANGNLMDEEQDEEDWEREVKETLSSLGSISVEEG